MKTGSIWPVLSMVTSIDSILNIFFNYRPFCNDFVFGVCMWIRSWKSSSPLFIWWASSMGCCWWYISSGMCFWWVYCSPQGIYIRDPLNTLWKTKNILKTDSMFLDAVLQGESRLQQPELQHQVRDIQRRLWAWQRVHVLGAWWLHVPGISKLQSQHLFTFAYKNLCLMQSLCFTGCQEEQDYITIGWPFHYQIPLVLRYMEFTSVWYVQIHR